MHVDDFFEELPGPEVWGTPTLAVSTALLIVSAGRRLADLHVDYEGLESYPIDVQVKSGSSAEDRRTWRVSKMKWKSKDYHSAIVYDP